jgi:hypothetical protein
MTGAENERLAVLETKVDLMSGKVDVMSVTLQGLVIAAASTAGIEKSRAGLGTWTRSFIPWLIAGIAAGAAVYNAIA